ncbi:hypothetical protein niasHT_036469 [Heterodera trifolii]|uniref:Integrase catalytic domain-containing protein n=1 Tax=Heterodera trifolii TaxID=157864 RepID=A0ABD2J6P6_9BILA
MSDNAPTFVQTSKAIDILTGPPAETDPVTFAARRGIQWDFIPAYSPWMGACYERLIGLVKSCIKRTIGRRKWPPGMDFGPSPPPRLARDETQTCAPPAPTTSAGVTAAPPSNSPHPSHYRSSSAPPFQIKTNMNKRALVRPPKTREDSGDEDNRIFDPLPGFPIPKLASVVCSSAPSATDEAAEKSSSNLRSAHHSPSRRSRSPLHRRVHLQRSYSPPNGRRLNPRYYPRRRPQPTQFVAPPPSGFTPQSSSPSDTPSPSEPPSPRLPSGPPWQSRERPEKPPDLSSPPPFFSSSRFAPIALGSALQDS